MTADALAATWDHREEVVAAEMWGGDGDVEAMGLHGAACQQQCAQADAWCHGVSSSGLNYVCANIQPQAYYCMRHGSQGGPRPDQVDCGAALALR